ncbi:MAG: amidohydrolase family protein [Bacteroidota bacterium]
MNSVFQTLRVRTCLITGWASIICAFASFRADAQETYPVMGIPYRHDLPYVFKNASVHTDHRTVLDSAMLIVKTGVIEAIGKNLPIPVGSIVQDLKGMHIYPSFIDPYSHYGISGSEKDRSESGDVGRSPQANTNTKGAYSWNEALRPEIEGQRLFVANEEIANKMRNAGFGMALTLPKDGIARGSGCVVLLGSGKENELLVKEKAASAFSFNKGSSKQEYPTSEMGAIALLRQSFLDAEWYASGGFKEERNISIQAWIDNRKLPMFFESSDYLQSLRIDKVGDEFGVKFIIKGSGDEYKRADEISKTGNTYILPLRFPEAYNVSDPYDTRSLTLEDLMNWEQAPFNAITLENKGVRIAFTSTGLKDVESFAEQLRLLHSLGMSKESILKATTETPAELIGMSSTCGTLKKGNMANFLVMSGEFFDTKSRVMQNWIKGVPYVVKSSMEKDVEGAYNLIVEGTDVGSLLIRQTLNEISAKIISGVDTTSASIGLQNGIVSVSFEMQKGPNKGVYNLSGYRTKDGFEGVSNRSKSWSAKYEGSENETPIDSIKPSEKPSAGKSLTPPIAYGFEKMPVAEKILFRNATVWTNEKEGVLQNTDVMVDSGKIVAVGKNLSQTGSKVIDATGKHITPGMIDEHSHIAVSNNVNECSHAITSEVRIGDVLDPDDINIYRQLAGGVTTSQLLHGSCNPIGGQSGLIKLRWGKSAEGLKFENAPGFIKFALGENVKQANWGDLYRSRYPQSRMGVEQVYVDAFTRAIEYEAALKASKEKKSTVPFRRDLRMEAIAEIMNNKRHITCHSYQQGEITMLMRVADSLGFKVNTFTHILEGYKVADKMKAHGVGASSFSDWWAYKYEVIEAIPHNGSILHDVGVTVAFNSDDAEMARRLNQEAAKAVRYGGVSEEEALKFVTLNPAKLLRIDNRVGSIKVGKDADLVLWNDHPLSSYAIAQQTYIDGICYFDMNRDEQMRSDIANERQRIITKMQSVSRKGGPTKSPSFQQKKIFHCMEDDDEIH